MALRPCRECRKPVSTAANACPNCGAPAPTLTRRPISVRMGLLIIAGLLVLIVQVMENISSSSPPERALIAPTVTPVDTAAKRRNDSAFAVSRERDRRELATLKARFIFERDEIHPDKGWYTHRSQTVSNSYNRTYLDAPVNAAGFVYLRSHYYGDDWIFHTKVIVRVGDRALESNEVPSYDPSNETSNSSGSVWETVSFNNRPDGGILDALAQATVRDTVIVRLEGKYAKTFRLSARDKIAIAESVRLAHLIRAFAH